MEEFEELLKENRSVIERYVKFRISSKFDVDDILQEIYMAAYQNFSQLKDREMFKGWILGIAHNKCMDHFRAKAKLMCIPIDSIAETAVSTRYCGISERFTVTETISKLGDWEKQILYLYYFKDCSQAEIAKRLNIPIGTVKSRLFKAKERFRQLYPYPPKMESRKGDNIMSKLPKSLPEYKITRQELAPFPVIFEELPNCFIVPKMGEQVTWGHYDMPQRNLAEEVSVNVACKIKLHGVEGVEINTAYRNDSTNWKSESTNQFYYAQLTDTHCRWLGESYIDRDGYKQFITFLDGDEFFTEWGFGEDNCGYETHLFPKNEVKRNGSHITTERNDSHIDVVGRFFVEMAGKTYDTVCIMDIFKNGVVTEQYVDNKGKTILWRRFNRENWGFEHYQKKWTEMYPDNEKIIVNDEVYVHWFDCVTDYIF